MEHKIEETDGKKSEFQFELKLVAPKAVVQ